jgi:hypothetical protein
MTTNNNYRVARAVKNALLLERDGQMQRWRGDFRLRLSAG